MTWPRRCAGGSVPGSARETGEPVSQDPTSLDRLHDLVLPAPTPFWPPAPGWLWLLGFAVIVTVTLLLVGLARWQRNRYRHEALSELARLESAGRDRQSDVVVGLSELLKRTALTAYPRSQVAALSGPSWFLFLDRAAGTRFSAGLGDKLEQALYRPAAAVLEPAELDALTDEVRAWIRQHQVPLADGPSVPGEMAAVSDGGLRGAA